MKTIQIKIIILSLLILLTFSGYLTPEHVQEHIKRLIAQKYQLYVINLGTSVNNNPLKAYVISGIKKQQNQLSQLTQYPATLITSYMHPREPYSIKLMQRLLDQVLNNYQTDYFFKYMLDNTLFILFPFVNIDGYYRYKMLQQQNTPKNVVENYRKNMNRYGKCINQWDYGVDINRNFDSSFGTLRTSDNQCGEEYRGHQPFSQKQSKAIKILFKKFNITLAIDIHSYGNKWIYPYSSTKSTDKLQKNSLYPIYQDLKEKMKKINKTMETCYQSLGYTADGVYIDWALDQGALALAVEIGTNFNHDNRISEQILFQVQQSFHLVLRKNSISYKKYMSTDGIFIIQSTSLIDFHVTIQDQQQNINANKYLRAGKYISFPEVSKSQKIILAIKDTLVAEQITLAQLQKINIGWKLNNKKLIKYAKLALFILSIIVITIIGVRRYRKRQQKIENMAFRLPKTIIQDVDEQVDNKLAEKQKLQSTENQLH